MAKGLDYVINLLDGSSSGVDKAKAKIGEVDSAIAGAENRSHGLGKALGMLGILVGSVFATEKIVDFGKESLEVAKSVRMVTAQVAQGIETTGGAAGRTIEQLQEQAEKLENTTLFSSQQTEGAQALILTFTAIKGAIFDEAIPAIQDLATRMGGDGPADLKGASIQVGKALNDPIRGITALQRVGVSFNKVQKDQIENLAKHNHLADAQRLILNELNKEFGGSAAAARRAAGPQADLTQAYDKLLKAVGPLIQKGIAPLVTWMAKGVTILTDWVSHFDVVIDAAKNGWKWIKQNADVFEDLAIGIGSSTAAFLIANPTVIAYGASLAADAIIGGTLALVTGALTAAQWLLNAAMTANPIGLIIVAVGALIGGLIYAYHHSEKFRAILAGIGSVAGTLIDIFVGLGKAIIGAFTFNRDLIKEGIIQSAGAINEIKEKGFSGIFNKGYDSSIKASEVADREEKIKQAATQVGAGKPGKQGAPGKLGKTPAVHGGGGGTTGGESTAAGRSIKHVTITFQSMIKEFHQTVNNLKGHDGIELKRIITELLSGAAADAEILIGE
jgi:hypothetical protein